MCCHWLTRMRSYIFDEISCCWLLQKISNQLLFLTSNRLFLSSGRELLWVNRVGRWSVGRSVCRKNLFCGILEWLMAESWWLRAEDWELKAGSWRLKAEGFQPSAFSLQLSAFSSLSSALSHQLSAISHSNIPQNKFFLQTDRQTDRPTDTSDP